MARALRIQCPGGRYHVTARGNERREIFSPWQRLVGGLVLGTVEFAESLRQQTRGNPREQKPLRVSPRAATWQQVVAAVEQVKGESWNQFAERHGDWGRDAALWLGRSAGRLRLAELGRRVGNLDYAVVSKAIYATSIVKPANAF